MRLKILLLFVFVMLISACGGLAGEPEIVGQLPQQQPPMSSANVEPPAIAPDLALGAQIYAENCTRCHGIVGAGDGEFVASGQITEIPDFTDPAQHAGRAPAEYYTQVTNGNLEKLMPPFSASLSDEERWAVANYVMTLANGADSVVPEPQTTEEAPETLPDETVQSPSSAVSEAGTINGAILQGTTGAAIPDDGLVTLTIVQMTGEQTTLETQLLSDGTYQFTDVPIINDAGYFVSMDYGNGTFSSEFASLTTASPEINLNITVYETTDDDSVIQLEVVLAQIDLIDENTLQIWQLISVVNTSDRLYVYEDNRGVAVSVKIPAPEGVRLSPNIDIGRFVFNDNAVYDSRPVRPGTEHSFHLLYTMPIDGKATFRQTFPYDFVGPYEAYVDSALLKISSDGWQTIDEEQTINGVSYQGIVRSGDLTANQMIEFTIQRKTSLLSRQTLGYVVIALGLILIVVSAVFYWRSPDTSTTSEPETVQSLMKQIADLDNQFERGEIAQADYDKQRKSLKDRVTTLMKAENQ